MGTEKREPIGHFMYTAYIRINLCDYYGNRRSHCSGHKRSTACKSLNRGTGLDHGCIEKSAIAVCVLEQQ